MLRLNIKTIPKTWFVLFIIIIFLGIFFRITNIENKVYWVDEVATSIRVAGYTKQEVTQNLASLKFISVRDLQKYQNLTVQKDLTATIKALIKSPEHSPLYFILTRFWVQRFGSSVVATRSLSVVFGLLAILCVYWLCQELFKTPLISWVAVALFAVSPFYVAYSQEARPYSLWIVTILSSNIALLRAIRLKNRQIWLLYTVSLTIGFYTSLFSIFVAIGQSIYVILLEKFNLTQTVKKYLLAFTLGIISFLPWLFIIFYNWQRFQDNTTWMRVPISLPIKIVIWIYSIAIVFVESPIYKAFDAIIIARIVTDLSLFALIIWAFYFL
ncbi:MAG: glycosyltransferase family 39 protein, partial [Tatlockia sp.]|nr:glycosyltransferase family 39 protein [Tatlockia sp.]